METRCWFVCQQQSASATKVVKLCYHLSPSAPPPSAMHATCAPLKGTCQAQLAPFASHSSLTSLASLLPIVSFLFSLLLHLSVVFLPLSCPNPNMGLSHFYSPLFPNIPLVVTLPCGVCFLSVYFGGVHLKVPTSSSPCCFCPFTRR